VCHGAGLIAGHNQFVGKVQGKTEAAAKAKTALQGRFIARKSGSVQASIDLFSLPMAFFSSCRMRSADTS
jgi:hypothetical protein